MDLEFTAEERAFQQEVREFLAESYPDHIREATAKTATVFVDAPPAMEWQKILVDKGWAVPRWPEEWGGTNWTASIYDIGSAIYKLEVGSWNVLFWQIFDLALITGLGLVLILRNIRPVEVVK